MSIRRHTRTGLLAGATLLAGLTIGAPTIANATAEGGACAEVREKVDRLEGRITPNACAFMKRQIAFGEAPSLQTYLDIFDEEASLWEAGAKPQRGHELIGASITNSLRLAPDLRYRGTDVVADGSVMMFGQQNTITLKGKKVSYPQIARNVLGDDGKTIQARRYYDRYELFEVLPESQRPRPLFAGIADPAGPGPRGAAPDRFHVQEIPARLAAWNSGDAAALAARTGNAKLAGPGLDRSLTTQEGKTAYLQRLFENADVEFKAGQVAFGRTTTYVEWHGTMTDPGDPRGTGIPFGIVERIGPKGEWELYFDTLPVIADQNTISGLFKALAS
ncbi:MULTISPECIES: hypothetical protein [unclassified Streptomyces]|uniref:hypothetical protein n=1 Tax=unclassified Streptomyces TaxID=2593676 RepID=UPI0029B5CE64|nr:hypothetical protein [Streptomyces sp. DK15]MDX2391067.1 hypothetical protein [Streptomyces sp. DK15]